MYGNWSTATLGCVNPNCCIGVGVDKIATVTICIKNKMPIIFHPITIFFEIVLPVCLCQSNISSAERPTTISQFRPRNVISIGSIFFLKSKNNPISTGIRSTWNHNKLYNVVFRVSTLEIRKTTNTKIQGNKKISAGNLPNFIWKKPQAAIKPIIATQVITIVFTPCCWGSTL